MRFHPDSSRLLLFAADNEYHIRVWKLDSSSCIAVLRGHYSAVTAMEFTADGSLLFRYVWTKVTPNLIIRALAGPWKSLNFFPDFQAWKVLENRHGPWKSLNSCLKVLESAWIWFSKTPWLTQLILKKVFQMASFWPQMCIKSILGPGFALDLTVGAYDTYTPCPGKKGTNSILGITSSNTDRFSNFFHFYNLIKLAWNIPSHLKRVTTLPCEILMSEN